MNNLSWHKYSTSCSYSKHNLQLGIVLSGDDIWLHHKLKAFLYSTQLNLIKVHNQGKFKLAEVISVSEKIFR